MSQIKRHKGSIGENLASNYLSKSGYKIIERNFRIRYGEIDIVALDKETIVFVEVKTRYSNEYGLPEESISNQKLKSLLKTSLIYQKKYSLFTKCCRIDLIAISLNSNGTLKDLKHLQNISQ